MTPFAKATLVLTVTFMLGTTVGFLGHATLVQARRGLPPRVGGPPPRPDERREGFVARTEALVEPHDDAQRNAIRPHLEMTDAANRAAVDDAREKLRVNMDTLRARLDSFLDAAQRARLSEFASRPKRGGPPGLGGPPGPR